MSIEETYKGQWSSDPSLLKSLLDAGETIIIKIITKDEQLRPVKADKDCFIDLNSGTRFGRQMASTKDFADMAGRLGIKFLVPPRPLVLEPKPLRWCMWDAFSSNLKARDEWRTSTGLLASGKVRYTVESRDARFYWRISNEGDYGRHAHGYCDTQEDAIREIEKWRQDHLEMPVFKCESEPMVEPKPLEWTKIDEGYFEAKDGAFTYQVDSSGFWSVDNIAHYPNTATDTESAKAAIQEWRVNHLKSILP